MSSEHNRETCSKLEPFIEDYLNGELPRTEAESLSAHLDACGDCRTALDDARISARLLSAIEPVADPGPGFAHMVMARIDVAERWMREQRSFWRPFEALAWRLAFTATLALAFLFAYGIRVSHQMPAEVTTVSVQQPDIFTVPVSTAPANNDDVLLAIADHHYEP